jgi:UDP-N-acetyl-D-mannosaminuronate dehydrogenase
LDELRVAVNGLGYVGFPLAVEFRKKRSVIGYDISHARIAALKNCHATTLEVSDEELREASGLQYTAEPSRSGRWQCLFHRRAMWESADDIGIPYDSKIPENA